MTSTLESQWLVVKKILIHLSGTFLMPASIHYSFTLKAYIYSN